MEYTPEEITQLEPNQVFVFGSNLAGRHGKGAAKQAVKFGAKYGQGVGEAGQTYAIPTKDKDKALSVLSIQSISRSVSNFFVHAAIHDNKEFLVTKIGCGLAGYPTEQIAPLFKDFTTLENVILPKEFIEILNTNK